MFFNRLSQIAPGIQSRSVSAENFTGERGGGGLATEGTGLKHAADLGRGWKISPSVKLAPGETFVLADIKGEGAVRHIWITDLPKQQRRSIIRFYWDNSEIPSVEVPLFAVCSFRSGIRQKNFQKIKKYSKIFKKTLDYLQKLVYTYRYLKQGLFFCV